MVRRVALGKTGLLIPKLCIGTGTGGCAGSSQQARVPVAAYAALLRSAHAAGLTFWDTSDDYGTHPHVREGLAGLPREDVILTTKTHARGRREARTSVRRSLEELGTSYVDILLMHEVDTLDDLRQRLPTLAEVRRLRDEGLVRAVGLSTHAYPVLQRAVTIQEIEVILTNFNRFEDHMDASLQAYSETLLAGHARGQGILVMKTLGEGRLAELFAETATYNLSRPFIHAVVVGISAMSELETLIALWHSLEGSTV